MKKTMKAFERSPMDKEPKGVKEGSPKDKAMDKKQFAAFKKTPMKGKKGSK